MKRKISLTAKLLLLCAGITLFGGCFGNQKHDELVDPIAESQRADESTPTSNVTADFETNSETDPPTTTEPHENSLPDNEANDDRDIPPPEDFADTELLTTNNDSYDIAEELNTIWGPAEEETPAAEEFEIDDLLKGKIKVRPTESSKTADEAGGFGDEDDSEWTTIYSNETGGPDDEEAGKKIETTPADKPDSDDPQKSEPDAASSQKIFVIVNRIKDGSSAEEMKRILVGEMDGVARSAESIPFLMDLKQFLPKTLHDPVNEKIAEILESERAKL